MKQLRKIVDNIGDYLDSHEYFLLVASHVMMLVFYPFTVTNNWSWLRLHLLITLVLVTGLYAAHSHKRFFVRTLLLWAVVVLLTRVNYVFVDTQIIALMQHSFGLLFFCVIMYNLVTTLHKMKEVDQHMIFGGIAGYLILWLIGAFVFTIIEICIPGSFSWFAVEHVSFTDFMYYSYVSMTTLWFGDVLPISYHAQSWSIFFTLSGQLYLAILIGMVVGKYIRRK